MICRRAAAFCSSTLSSVSLARLFDVHERADRDFGEEFSGRFLWQPNAAVRCRIVRHYACVDSEIETTQTHEIWHVHFVDRGSMVPLFVGDYEMASARGVAWPPGRTFSAEYRHAVFNKVDGLRSERNFEAELLRRRAAPQKDLCASPLARLGGNVQRNHTVALRGAIPVGPRIEQGPHAIFAAKTRGEHQHCDVPILFDIAAERL